AHGRRASEVRALREAGGQRRAAAPGHVRASGRARVVRGAGRRQARLIRAAALRARVDPLLVAIAHAGRAAGRRAGGLRRGALRLLGETRGRARDTLPRRKAAREARVVFGLTVGRAGGREADLLVRRRLLDARRRRLAEAHDERRGRSRRPIERRRGGADRLRHARRRHRRRGRRRRGRRAQRRRGGRRTRAGRGGRVLRFRAGHDAGVVLGARGAQARRIAARTRPAVRDPLTVAGVDAAPAVALPVARARRRHGGG